MIVTRLDYLGHRRSQRGRAGLVEHHVYVLWIAGAADLLTAVLHLQARGQLVCPECRAEWPLVRSGGLLAKLSEHPTGTVRSISDVCPDCPTVVHWDLSPVALHARLRWTRMYNRRPETMGDRPSRIGAACLQEGVA